MASNHGDRSRSHEGRLMRKNPTRRMDFRVSSGVDRPKTLQPRAVSKDSPAVMQVTSARGWLLPRISTVCGLQRSSKKRFTSSTLYTYRTVSYCSYFSTSVDIRSSTSCRDGGIYPPARIVKDTVIRRKKGRRP